MDMFSLNNSLSDRPEAPNQYTTQSSMSLSSHEDKSHSSNAPVMPTGSATIFPHQQSSSTFTDASTLTHSRDETLQAILSDMLKLDAFNLNTFLLSLLRRVDKSLPLDEFYNVLYNPKSDNGALQSAINKIDKTETSDDSESGMEIIQRVLEVFRFPETLYNQYPSLDGSDLKASNVNLHELLRSLLAIKILRHSLIETEDGDRHSERSPIPRLDIYKVYYILCQKLILKYPSSSNTTSLQQKLIFGQSKLGKLIKLVYPNLVSKRLGRRGESRYNYLGIRWNDNVVSDEIKALFRNDLPELADIFKVSKKQVHATPTTIIESTLQNKRNRSISQTEMINRIKAQGTFVEPTHFFPEGPFTSKAFLDEHLNDNIERNWFAAALKLSSDALEESGVSSDEIHRLLFGEDEPLTEEDDILLRGIIDIVLPKLSASPNQPKIFLHLFMVISLKVFPHLLSLRKPLHTENIKRLTSKVSYLIKRIEGEMSPLVSQKMQQHDIRNFLGILSRMIHLNQLLAAFFKADLQDYILKEMQEDVTRVATEGSKDGLNETYRLISEACISVLLANRYKPQFRGVPVKSNIRQFLFESCHTIEQMVSHDLASFVTNVMEGWLPQTEESFHGALKFRLLLATLKLVDEGQDKTILELISKRNRLDRKINEMLNEAAEQTDPRKIIDLDEAKSFVNRYLLRQKEKSQQISSLIDKHKRFQQDAAQQKKVILEDHEKLSPKKISGLTKLSQLNSSEKSRLDEELKKRLQSHYEMVADRQRQLSQESDAMLHELGVP
ncbi:uncharacterized protein CXQ87_003999 [Candidozyma duobushaemuli]|uniref:RFX-type winged-helix domain-containing protein n=1 Tax=Candidozyma duobushaemuli TaxID=1231522 RepID=A0A2V1AEJ9_9ASCO|nr:uncharacterized protein CXQ87_003999 [[Candida] duobushaemulonis]PVH16135.1 hypothetical protein CXQ87_003999 [[Candida] duobushaemulonis]